MDTSHCRGSRHADLSARLIAASSCLLLAISPGYALASVGMGGWSVTNVAAAAGVATINATKTAVTNGVSKTINSFAKVTPTGSQIAKGIVKFGSVAAVVTAIDMLLGGIDWVLDPANNSVIYQLPCTAGSSAACIPHAVWVKSGYGMTHLATYPQSKIDTSPIVQPTYQKACESAVTPVTILLSLSVLADGRVQCNMKDQSYGTASSFIVVQVSIAGGATEEKRLSYDAVGNQIAANAAAGDPAANNMVADVANPNSWESDNEYPIPVTNVNQQLAANAKEDEAPPQTCPAGKKFNTETATCETVTGNVNPETGDLELPEFCSWIPTAICNWYYDTQPRIENIETATNETKTEVKAQTESITKTANEAEATRKELEKVNEKLNENAPNNTDNTTVDIPTAVTPPTVSINFGGTCPAPVTIPIELGFVNTSFQMSYDPLCSALEIARPVIIASAGLSACYIVAGRGTEDN